MEFLKRIERRMIQLIDEQEKTCTLYTSKRSSYACTYLLPCLFSLVLCYRIIALSKPLLLQVLQMNWAPSFHSHSLHVSLFQQHTPTCLSCPLHIRCLLQKNHHPALQWECVSTGTCVPLCTQCLWPDISIQLHFQQLQSILPQLILSFTNPSITPLRLFLHFPNF